MNTNELIDRLREIDYKAENPEDCGLSRDHEKEVPEIIDEIIRKLQQFDLLRKNHQETTCDPEFNG